jgi:leucyl/phenylalanyl-tRNA--protein transferase
MQWDGLNIAYIEPGDDFAVCADVLSEPYRHEFAIHPTIAPDEVENACRAGFMPMAMILSSQDGDCKEYFTPKLHLERCLLDPATVHISDTARRESKKYSLSLNRSFDEVLDGCVRQHGDGWLTDALVDSFRQLHAERTARAVKFVSAELWKQEESNTVLVAGEIGYRIGVSYASLTGFSRVSGAGTVQLTTLGAVLASAGIKVWDLGMAMDYKTNLGGLALPRRIFLPALRHAYSARLDAADLDPCATSALQPAREVIAKHQKLIQNHQDACAGA